MRPVVWTNSHIWKSEILHAQPAKYSWFNSIWTVIVVICEHCLAWICCFVHLVTLTPLIAHIIYCWMLFLVWFPCFVRSGCSWRKALTLVTQILKTTEISLQMKWCRIKIFKENCSPESKMKLHQHVPHLCSIPARY